MLRPFACAATVLALCGPAVPAFTTARAAAPATGIAAPATSTTPPAVNSAVSSAVSSVAVVYGYAWADGTGHLRVLPGTITRVRRSGHPFYRLKDIPGARELRLGHSAAAYNRVTLTCDLKETEGRVAVDRTGFGTTVCDPIDLTASLQRGPVAVRVRHAGGEAAEVTEFLAEAGDPRLASGTIKRVDDRSVLFTMGAKTVRLGYTHALSFSRVTAGCDSGWLAGRPVNAGRDGLGRKDCQAADLTRALKRLRHPVSARVDYQPGSRRLFQVWEVFGDA